MKLGAYNNEQQFQTYFKGLCAATIAARLIVPNNKILENKTNFHFLGRGTAAGIHIQGDCETVAANSKVYLESLPTDVQS